MMMGTEKHLPPKPVPVKGTERSPNDPKEVDDSIPDNLGEEAPPQDEKPEPGVNDIFGPPPGGIW